MTFANRWLVWGIRHFSWLLCLTLILVFVAWVPAFRRWDYWQELVRLNFNVLVLALVLTPVVLTGGIDLSVGSVALFSSVVVGVCWKTLDWPLPTAFAAGIVAGGMAGMVNGTLVVIGIPSLVTTLATRELFRGLAASISENKTIQLPAELTQIWEANPLGLPLPLLGLLVLFALTYLVVHQTWMGRMLYAIGDNREAARFAAVPVRSLEFGCFAATGLVAGLCGACWVLRYANARPDSDQSLELLAIAGIVLGGVRITGGAGHVAGTMLGATTLVVLLAGLQRVQANWRDALTGMLLLTVALTNEAAVRWTQRRQAEAKQPGSERS